MPTLVFADSFSRMERVMLGKTFRANCKYMGITDVDCAVELRRERIGCPNRQGMMTKLEDENRFIIILNVNGFDLYEAISVLGHEMTHVRQYIKGHMTDDGMGGVNWKGSFYPSGIAHNNAFYREVPWEREAHGNQRKVFKNALKALTPEELAIAKHEHEHAKVQRRHRTSRAEMIELIDALLADIK